MSEVTIIWNQQESFQDTSEVWDPSEEDGLTFLRNSQPGYYPRHVIIKGRVGYMVMTGIYYFGDPDDGTGPVRVSEWDDSWTREMAVMGRYTWSGGSISIVDGFEIMYLAVDKENIEILKRFHRTLLAEPEVKLLESSKVREGNCTGWGIGFWGEREAQDGAVFPDSLKRDLEQGAEELMEGIGIHYIRVGLKYIFLPRVQVREYEYAYRMGNKVVLINGRSRCYTDSAEGRNEYDLRILEELTVRRTEKLRCGIFLNRDYHLIDCKAIKERQVLTREAYEIFKECNVQLP